MGLWESLKIAIRSLNANKVRSLLTMLGVVIGVASIVTIVAVGSGAQVQVAERIRSLGANVLMVVPGEAREGGARMASGSGHTLTEADATRIATDSYFVTATAPSVRGASQIVAGNKNWNTVINGTTKDYFTIREWGLSEGRYFSDRDTLSAAKVALIGQTVKKELFEDGETAIGRRVRIANTPFEIAGVLAEKGPSGSGRDQDDIVFVPISTAKLRLMGSAHQVNRDAVAYILAKAASDETIEAAEQEITSLLRQQHRLQTDEEDDFKVVNPAAAMSAQRAATRTVAWLLAAVASVSLVVGGISIMNIMLVSVTERTREIGLRLAVGARRRDLRNQFLMEALTLCVLGGLVGIAIGIVTAIGIAKISGWPVFLSAEAMLSAIAFAGTVGLFFGYYPAKRASEMNPIDCLRSD